MLQDCCCCCCSCVGPLGTGVSQRLEFAWRCRLPQSLRLVNCRDPVVCRVAAVLRLLLRSWWAMTAGPPHIHAGLGGEEPVGPGPLPPPRRRRCRPRPRDPLGLPGDDGPLPWPVEVRSGPGGDWDGLCPGRDSGRSVSMPAWSASIGGEVGPAFGSISARSGAAASGWISSGSAAFASVPAWRGPGWAPRGPALRGSFERSFERASRCGRRFCRPSPAGSDRRRSGRPPPFASAGGMLGGGGGAGRSRSMRSSSHTVTTLPSSLRSLSSWVRICRSMTTPSSVSVRTRRPSRGRRLFRSE